MTTNIYDLPNEVLIIIFEQIKRPSIWQHHDAIDTPPSKETRQEHWNSIIQYRHVMDKIRLVDRRFHDFATPLRFRLLFTNRSATQIDRLFALSQNSKIASHVRGIEIAPCDSTAQDVDNLGQALRCFPALEELVIDWNRGFNGQIYHTDHLQCHAWWDLLHCHTWPSLKKVWFELDSPSHLKCPHRKSVGCVDTTSYKSFELLHVDFTNRFLIFPVGREEYLRDFGAPQCLKIRSLEARSQLYVNPDNRLRLSQPMLRNLELYNVDIRDPARELAAALTHYMQPGSEVTLQYVNVIYSDGYWANCFDNLKFKLGGLSARYLGYYEPISGNIWSNIGLTRLDEILDIIAIPGSDVRNQQTYRRLREKHPNLVHNLERIKRYEKLPIYFEIIEDLRETASMRPDDTKSLSKLKRRNGLRDIYTIRNRYVV